MKQQNFVKLIFENLPVLVQAANLIEGEFSHDLYETIEEIVQESMSLYADTVWSTCIWDIFRGYDYKELTFAPQTWKAERQANKHELADLSPDEWYACFNLSISTLEYLTQSDYQFGNNKNCFPVSQFFKNNHGSIIFTFKPSYRFFNKSYSQKKIYFEENSQAKARIPRAIWNIYWQQQAEKYLILGQYGFKFCLDYSYWYLPIEKLEPTKVAECYSIGSLKKALDPIREALESIKIAYPVFNQIVAEAKEHLN